MSRASAGSILVALTLAACGGQGDRGQAGRAGSPGAGCTVKDNGDGTATVRCGDGSQATLSGSPHGDGGAPDLAGSDVLPSGSDAAGGLGSNRTAADVAPDLGSRGTLRCGNLVEPFSHLSMNVTASDFASDASFALFEALNSCACTVAAGCRDSCDGSRNGTALPDLCNDAFASDICSGCLQRTCAMELDACFLDQVFIPAVPPPPGPLVSPDGNGTVTFAVAKLYLGDTEPDGTPDRVYGWTHYGFDIDGRLSVGSSTDLCTRVDNAAASVQADGPGGLDNSFGKSILPIILGIASDAPSKVNDAFTQGRTTLLFDFDRLGTGSSYNPILVRQYTGAPLASPPNFNGNDVWPVTADSVTDPANLGSAVAQFPQGYVVDNTWVSGTVGRVLWQLDLAGFVVTIPINQATITMAFDASHTSATRGIISGVIPTDELEANLREAAGRTDPSLCFGPTIDSIIAEIRQASDILADGTQNPALPCDGISIGLGFDAKRVLLGAVAPPVMPPPSVCP